MDPNSGSGSGKRPCETEDDKESEMKRPRLQLDVLASFPNELWARIFSYLGIRDWGRLEAVSSQFRTLLLEHSWTTLENLTVDPNQFCHGYNNREHTHSTLAICCNSFPKFRLSVFRASKLLGGIAAKAPKLLSLQLPNFLSEWCRDEEEPLRALGLLPRLSCPALRKFQFSTYIRSMGTVREVAQVLGQTKETLTELDLGLILEAEAEEEFVTRATEVLKPVFDSLNNLETLSIGYDMDSIGSSTRYNEYLLMNKPKLSDLSLEFLADDDNEYTYIQPARALLESKSKLEVLFLDSDSHYGGFLSEYAKQLGSSSQLHPLSSIKRFDSAYHSDLGPDVQKLLRLCPKLEEIYGHGTSRSGGFDDGELVGSLIRFMGTFLNKFAVGERERVLQLNLPYFQRAFREEHVGRLELLTGLLVQSIQNVPCPEFRYEYGLVGRLLDTVPVKVFRKRHATVRLALALLR